MDVRKKITKMLVADMKGQVDNLTDVQASQLYSLINKPGLRIRPDRKTTPFGVNITTNYGTVQLDSTLTTVSRVFVNSAKFKPVDASLNGLNELLNGDAKSNLVEEDEFNNRRRSKGRRVRTAGAEESSFEDVQQSAFEDLSSVKLAYDNLYKELGSVIGDASYTVEDVMNELIANKVPEPDIPRFLAYESDYNKQIVGQLYGVNYGDARLSYNFKPLVRGEHLFADRIVDMIGADNVEYDEKFGVLKINEEVVTNGVSKTTERLITNLPEMDERGVFSTKNTKYIPYHVGYFADGEGSRVDRLRHIDPVQDALDAVKLQYELSSGDIKFKSLLDVSRNLPDFDKHPYGDEILDTYKRKIVLDKKYLKTNSLLAEYQGQADELGAVALTMLDDDAKGLIDPYGTSNGGNMGVIFYLTKDAEFNPDGTLTRGQSEHSLVGDILDRHNVDKDNFNRNQMSFNAFLTSLDVKKINVAYCEFAMFNAEDAVVMTKTGAQKFGQEKLTGDKVSEYHGNKSTISLIIDADMDPEQAKKERLNNAVEFAKLNPDLDMIVSPISLASRLNMGVAHEGLSGNKKDLYLPDGTVVKDGIVEIEYMSLPQTAEHKSKDYGVEGSGRKYSNLFRHALSSKVGDDMYRKAIISDEVREKHVDEIATAFERQGVTFKNEAELIKPGNVKLTVDNPLTVSASDYRFKIPAVVRLSLQNQMEAAGETRINIDLGKMEIVSPMTGEVMKDSEGRNVLPIRVEKDGGIPYRYNDVFKNMALGNKSGLQKAYDSAISVDYKVLTRKNNLLKNIDTMTFFEGAKTEVMVADPRLGIGEIRTSIDCDRVVAHRDPVIQSGNTISFKNVGGNAENMTHVNPLILKQIDGDCDGDTLGENSFDNLNLTDAEKDIFFERSSVEEQLNKYGEVFLGVDGSHFKAVVNANGIDDSNVTFKDGKSNAELRETVDNIMREVVDSPKSYGAYAVSFENDKSVIDTLGKLAEDGVKGNKEDMQKYFNNGYTPEENRAVMKALIAKSEWTGLAGAITNDLIAGFGANEFDEEFMRVAMDITHGVTQSVLQMKKNADKLGEIDKKISQMKTVMSGKYDAETSRVKLHEITEGLVASEAVDKFVDIVKEKQLGQRFGEGVFNNQDLSTNKLAYTAASSFSKNVVKVANQKVDNQILSDEELEKIMNDFENNFEL